MLRMLAQLVKILNEENDPSQISLAFCFSLFNGFLPFLTPIGLLVLFIVFSLRVNLSAFFLGWAFFSGVAYLLDPLFHLIGLAVLTAAPLEGLWTAMYNSTIWRIQKFNNTVVMGGFVAAAAGFVPLFFALNSLIRKYREHVLAWIRKTRIVRMIQASDFYRYYRTASGWTRRFRQ